MLTHEDMMLLTEACSIYLQVVSQQAQVKPEQLEMIKKKIENIFIEIQPKTQAQGIAKPAGISDEWFENVCKTCDRLNGSQCKDTVTKNFPGKCDPILKFEQNKWLLESKKDDLKPEGPQLKIYKEGDASNEE